ncbi:MAG: hypothetical protein Q8Q40_11175 [Methylococcaceae bacterium]|nr:hypothetical protein [Methylococcaceae bacterium]MDP3904523.1 hypothetical protein [Methylococcaceae bacterium]
MANFVQHRLIIAAFLLAAICSPCGAASVESLANVNMLTDAQVKQELEDIDQLTDLLPFEKQDPVHLKKQLIDLGYKVINEKTDQFGLTRIRLTKKTTTKDIKLRFEYLNNDLADYGLSVDIKGTPSVNSQNQPLDKLIWDVLQKQGAEMSEEPLLHAHKMFQDIFDKYYQVVTAGKNDLKPVNISGDSKQLNNDYIFLVSDTYAYSAAGNDCVPLHEDYYSSNASNADSAINNLLAIKRLDLIENILDGFNPVGRIYAIRALENLGLSDDKVIKNKINKILDMNTPINVCKKTHLTAREYKNSIYINN